MVKWPGEGWGHKEGLREEDCFLCFIFFFSCQELVPKETQRYSYMTASTFLRKGGLGRQRTVSWKNSHLKRILI